MFQGVGRTDDLFAGFGDDDDDVDIPIIPQVKTTTTKTKRTDEESSAAEDDDANDEKGSNKRIKTDSNGDKPTKTNGASSSSLKMPAVSIQVRVTDESIQGVEKQYDEVTTIGGAPASSSANSDQEAGGDANGDASKAPSGKLAIRHSVSFGAWAGQRSDLYAHGHSTQAC
jgi:hypothetical protein